MKIIFGSERPLGIRGAALSGAVVAAFCAVAAPNAAEGASWSDGARTWFYEPVPGGASVTGASPVPAQLAVPASVAGLAVVALGDGAFADADGVSSLSLPATLRSIGEGAFFGCDGLARVEIPASVSSIGDWAFSHCSSLSAFSAGAGSSHYSASSGVLFDASRRTLVRWPGGKTGPCAVPSGVVRIETGAFCGADGVTSVSIPASVSAIGDRAFAHCGALASFSVAPGNASFAVSPSEGACGALVSADGGALLAVPAAAVAGKTFVAVPDGVVRVGPSALAGISGATSASLPSSVREIGDGAFLGCGALLAVDCDSASDANGPGAAPSVETIGREAFLWCVSVVEVPTGSETAVVGDRAFSGCARLAAAELGPATVSAGSGVFSGCAALSKVRWRGGVPAGVAADVFSGAPRDLAVVADAGGTGWPAAWPAGAEARSVVRDGGLSPVFRFWSKGYRAHFYTIDENEKDVLVSTNPNWAFEGTAYFAEPHSTPETVPLYRFYSKNYRGHFFTTDLEEKRTVMRTNPNWKYEGVAFRVFPGPGGGLSPVFRFWSKEYRHHFYTIDEEEKDVLIATNPHWAFEMTAFYAAESGSGPLEVLDSAPAAEWIVSSAVSALALDPPLKAGIALPKGAAGFQLWQAGVGVADEGGAEGVAVLDLDIRSSGAWHWLRAFDDEGGTVLSVWFRVP